MLWNKNHEAYKRKDKAWYLWKDIANFLGTAAAEAKHRFEIVLRKKYMVESRRPNRSGDGLDGEEWEHLHALSFLEKTIVRRKGKSNISPTMDDSSDSWNGIIDFENVTVPYGNSGASPSLAGSSSFTMSLAGSSSFNASQAATQSSCNPSLASLSSCIPSQEDASSLNPFRTASQAAFNPSQISFSSTPSPAIQVSDISDVNPGSTIEISGEIYNLENLSFHCLFCFIIYRYIH